MRQMTARVVPGVGVLRCWDIPPPGVSYFASESIPFSIFHFLFFFSQFSDFFLIFQIYF